MISFTLRRDTITSDLRARIAGVSGARNSQLLKAVADVLAETAKGAFNNSSY